MYANRMIDLASAITGESTRQHEG